MIDPKELAAALEGCTISALDAFGTSIKLTVELVTPPPKKPEVRVQSAPMRDALPEFHWHDGEPDEVTRRTGARPDYWLRRETIDGIPQTPSVVEAK